MFHGSKCCAAIPPLRSKYVGDWQSDLKHGQAVEDPTFGKS